MAITLDYRKLPPDVQELMHQYAQDRYGYLPENSVGDDNLCTLTGDEERVCLEIMEETGMTADEVSAEVVRLVAAAHFGPKRRHCRERTCL